MRINGALRKSSKHLKPLHIFAKCFILDVWQGSEYDSVIVC